MKRFSKKKLAQVLILMMLFYLIPGQPESIIAATGNQWKTEEGPVSAMEVIETFDGENYIGGTKEKSYILADADMNVLYQGGDVAQISHYSGYELNRGVYCVREYDTDGKAWRGVIDADGNEILPFSRTYSDDWDWDWDITVYKNAADEIYFFDGEKDTFYNADGKLLASEKDFLDMRLFPQADDISIKIEDYTYRCFGLKGGEDWEHPYIYVRFREKGKEIGSAEFEFKGNIVDHMIDITAMEEDKKTICDKAINEYLRSEYDDISSALKEKGYIPHQLDTDGNYPDIESGYMANILEGEKKEQSLICASLVVGYDKSDDEDYLGREYYEYIFDREGNCIVNGRKNATLCMWYADKNGMPSGYSFKDGNMAKGFDYTGKKLFEMEVSDEAVNIAPIKRNSNIYYLYWTKALNEIENMYVNEQIEYGLLGPKPWGLLDQSGNILWDANECIKGYEISQMNTYALPYGKIVYPAVYYAGITLISEPFDYVYNYTTKELIGKYEDSGVLEDNTFYMKYTDEKHVSHMILCTPNGKEFEVTLDEMPNAGRWLIKYLEESGVYAFYGYKDWETIYDNKQWNDGGQCAVIVDENGNQLASAVSDTVFVHEKDKKIVTFKAGNYVLPAEKPLRTPLPKSTEEPSASLPTIVEKPNGYTTTSKSPSAATKGSNISLSPDKGKSTAIPGRVSLKTVKNTDGKTVKILYKKVSNATGYQILCATDKKFKKNKRNRNTSKTNCTIKNLKRNKTYYFRVRAFKIADGKKVYGKWSKVKKCKVK